MTFKKCLWQQTCRLIAEASPENGPLRVAPLVYANSENALAQALARGQ